MMWMADNKAAYILTDDKRSAVVFQSAHQPTKRIHRIGKISITTHLQISLPTPANYIRSSETMKYNRLSTSTPYRGECTGCPVELHTDTGWRIDRPIR